MSQRVQFLLPFTCIAVMAFSGCVSSAPVATTAGGGAYAPPPPGYVAVPADNQADYAPDSSSGIGLQSGVWQLRSYGAPGAERRLGADTDISIRFGEDTRASGAGGCNGFFTSYELGPGNTLSLGPVGRSKKICPGGVMAIENEFFNRLSRVSYYVISGNILRLYYDNGEGVLHFAGR